MDNSLVTHLRGYYDALFLDLASQYSCQREWARDRTRLLLNLENRGSRLATLDLPTIGKFLEEGIENGRLSVDRPHLMRRKSAGISTPKFLGDLFLQIFDSDGVLRSDASPAAVFTVRQLTLSSKKLRITCNDTLTYAEVRNFFSIEEGIREGNLPWGHSFTLDPDILLDLHLLDGDTSSISTQCLSALYRCQRIADIVSSQFGDFSDEKPLELPKHGPGVVSNHGRAVSKYSFPEWPEKLSVHFPYDSYVWSDYDLSTLCSYQDMLGWDQESPSRLIAVPKTQKGPRLIAAEPSQNQWIQQLIRAQLESRWASTCAGPSVNFRSQIPNQVAALRGSRDGTLCTIDLSSASDRLSCWTVERIFRRNISFLNRLNSSRTGSIQNGIDSFSPGISRLKKFAAMGSACTFPVQSAVYAIVAIASLSSDRITASAIAKWARQVHVYGDDIIVPADRYELVSEMLTFLGLKVNTNKSFFRGPFRESCGIDAFAGIDVTPAYLLNPVRLASASTVSSHVEVANNFFCKGLWHVSRYLDDGYSHFRHLLPIVKVGRDDTSIGLYSFAGENFNHLRKRWNEALQRIEHRTLREASKPTKYPADGLRKLMKFFHEAPQHVTVDGQGVVLDFLPRILDTISGGTSLARPGWTPYLSS